MQSVEIDKSTELGSSDMAAQRLMLNKKNKGMENIMIIATVLVLAFLGIGIGIGVSVGRKSSAAPASTSGCPCVDTSALFTGYIRPRNWGSSCVAWDKEPFSAKLWGGACAEANPPDWCADAYCYVDPKTCDVGSYQSDIGAVQAAGLEWSYKTCNASFKGNSWVGDCECTGVTGVFNGTERPTNWGASCAAWNDGDGKWPDCVSETPPDWCKTKWCYVDTDACAVKHHPQPSIYGKPGSGDLHWSYDACDKNFAGNTYVGFPSPPPPAPPA